MVGYTYNVGSVIVEQLSVEIAPVGTFSFISYDQVLNDLVIFYESSLSPAEEALLLSIVNAHVPNQLYNEDVYYYTDPLIVNGLTVSISPGTAGYVLMSGTSGDVSWTQSLSEVSNVLVVEKEPGIGEFSSIKSAMDSITGNTASNPYIIKVGPGVYIEDTITFKPYVSITGESYVSTIIQVDSPNKDVIIGADQATIKNVTLKGATSSGSCAIKYSSGSGIATAFFNVEDVRFGANNILIKTIGISGQSCSVQCTNVKFGGSGNAFDTGFWATYDTSGSSTIQLRSVTTTNGSIVSPVSTFALADGPSCQIVCNGAQVNKSGTTEGTAFKAINGGSLRLTSVNIRNWGIAIDMPNTGSATNVSAIGMNFESNTQDLVVTHASATGKVENASLEKSSISDTSSVYIVGVDLNTIRVSKTGGGDFTSIKDAVDFITDSSETNRYIIEIGPGIYYEDEIDLSSKSSISLVGSSIETTQIYPNGATHHVIKIGTGCEISFLTIVGAGTGSAGIYCYDIGDFGQAHKVSFADCDTCIWVESNTQDTYFYGEYVDYGGTYSYGTRIIANNGFASYVNLENYYNLGFCITDNYVSGPGSKLDILASGNEANGTGKAIHLVNGAICEVSSAYFDGYDTAIYIENTGAASTFKALSVNLVNSVTYDIDVEHIGAVGVFNGIASHTKIINNSSNFSWSFLDADDGELDITNKLSITFADGEHTDMSTLIGKSSTMGVISGGDLSIVSGFTISISSGYGYLEKTNTDIIKRLDWATQSIGLSASTNSYIYFNENGNLVSGSQPSLINNVLLGRVVTNDTEIEFLDRTRLNADHTANRYARLFREGLGVVYSSGSLVTENATQSLHLDVSSGKYFFSSNVFTPSGGNNITFDSFYRGTSSNWIISSTNSVDNAYYDGGTGSLISLSASYYAKHSLYVVGDNSTEEYFMVYAQAQYSSQLEAQEALPPSPPSYFTDGVSLIAGIIVQQGTSSIIEVRDQRPTIAFRSDGVSAAASHGNLQGLGNDDHTQYLLVDGARAMSGNLNMGNNSIINVNLVDGVDVSSHSTRHLPNGADALTTGTPSSIGSTNQQGIANAFARQDHVHALGSNIVGDDNISAHTTTKITTTNKSLLNSSIVYTDQSNTFGTFSQSFKSGNFSIFNPTNTFSYGFTASAISANRNVLLPLLTSDDIFVFQSFSQSLTNKTLLSTNNNVIDATRLRGLTISTATPNTNDALVWNGSQWSPSAVSTGTSSGISRTLANVTTTNATITTIATASITDNATSIVEVYVKAYQSGGTNWGVWKRTLTLTKVSGTLTIREENADVDKQSTGLRATSVSFTTSSGSLLVQVTGIAATTISWNSAYEIIL